MDARPYLWPENRDTLNLTFHGHLSQPRFALVTFSMMPRPASWPENDTHTGGYAREPRGAARRRHGYIGAGGHGGGRGDMRPGARGGCGGRGRRAQISLYLL